MLPGRFCLKFLGEIIVMYGFSSSARHHPSMHLPIFVVNVNSFVVPHLLPLALSTTPAGKSTWYTSLPMRDTPKTETLISSESIAT